MQPYLLYNEYDVFIEVLNSYDVENYMDIIQFKVRAKDSLLIFKFMTLKDNFTEMQLGLKIFCSVVSLVGFFIFRHYIKKLTMKERSFEQNLMLYMSFFLFLFNDPIYIFSVHDISIIELIYYDVGL